jgi:predicted PurR-regulated permease PerM
MGSVAPMDVKIQVSLKTVGLVLGLVGLFWVLSLAWEFFLLLLLSGVLAASLYPPVAWLKNRNFPRRLSILGFYLLFLILSVILVAGLATMLLDQGRQFFQHLPGYLASAGDFIRTLPFIDQDQELLTLLGRHLETIAAQVVKFLFSSLDYLFVVFGGLISVLTVSIFTYFLLTDTHYFESTMLRVVPPPQRSKVQGLMRAIAHKVGFYIRGQLLVMALMGILTGVGLSIVGVPYAAVLGALVFALDIIPLVGPILATFVGVVVALGQDPMMAVWALLVFFVAQQLENYVFAPMILGKTLDLHPFWILLSLILGGALMGIVGVILAVPLAATIRILIEELYLKGYLDKRYPPEATKAGLTA